MKRILSIMIAAMLIVMSLPMVGFAADVSVYAVGDNVAEGVVTNLSWKTSNTVTVEFDGTVDPATVNATTVTLTEKGGIEAEVPMIIDATAEGATIKLGKLRPLTDYVLTFDGGDFAKTEIELQSASTDIREHWFNGRGAQGQPAGFYANTAAYNDLNLFGGGWTSNQPDHWEFTRDGSAGFMFYRLLRPEEGDLGNITFEYNMRVKAGTLKTGGVNKYDSNYYSSMTTTEFKLFNYTETRSSNLSWHRWRINFFRGSDGYYYGNGYVLNNTTKKWTKVGDDVKLLIGSSPITEFNAGTNWWRDICYLNLGSSGAQQIGSKKMTISSLPETGIMDLTTDFEDGNGKIYVTFDQKIDTDKSSVGIVGYTGADVEFTDAYNCVLTIGEELLAPSTTYEIDMAGVVADSGVIGGTGAEFTTPKSDKITASAANTTNLSWKEANEVVVTFSDAIVPASVNESTVTFTEKDGTIVDIPMVIDTVTSTSATIKLGKLKPLTDYKLNIKDVEPYDSSLTFQESNITLQSASSDITEQWYGERGLNGNASNIFDSNMSYASVGSKTTEDGETYYKIDSKSGFLYGKNGTGSQVNPTNLYHEYMVRVNSGTLGTAGVHYSYDTPRYTTRLTTTELEVRSGEQGIKASFPATGWVHYSVEQYAGEDGLIYGNVKVKTVDENGALYWKPLISDILVTNTAEGRNTIGSKTWWWVTCLGAGGGTAATTSSVDIKKFVMSTLPATGIMASDIDLDNNKIELMFDQKVDTASAGNIKIYAVSDTEKTNPVEATAVCEDGLNLTITLQEALTPGAEYELDMSALKAESGVLGGAEFKFTANAADVEVVTMSIGDDLLTSSVTVKKNVTGTKDITIILALYDGGNSLVKAVPVPKKVTQDEITYTDVAITDVTVQTGYKAKLMVWEGGIEDVTPICEAIEK